MLFETRRPNEKLHPDFVRLRDNRELGSGRRLIEQAFARLPARDRNFIEQFQATGFDSRTFELYLSEVLQSEGFLLSGSAEQPDFEATKNGCAICIECTTTNPMDDGKGPRLRPYRPINPADASLADIRRRAHHDIPLKIGGALRNKMDHRVTCGDGKIPYWDLPHCRGKPFIIALQSLSEDGALGFTATGVGELLYGVQHWPAYGPEGELMVIPGRVADYVKKPGTPPIPAGFLANHPNGRHLSGVLWSNAGDVSKFMRMALSGPFPATDVAALHYGQCYDPDPDADAGLPFSYVIGEDGCPPQTWGQEAVFFRNLDALHPVPEDLFDEVSDAYIDAGGAFRFSQRSPFVPFMSMTQTFSGENALETATATADRIYPILQATHQVQTLNQA